MNASTGTFNPLPSITPDSFAGDVFGQQPHEVDRVLSRLIQDNYDVADARRGEASPETVLPGTWARMDETAVRAAGIDPTMLHDAKSGFDASLYRDASGAVVLAFAGSDEWQDWPHNFRQGLGFEDVQYDQAIALANEVKRAFGDDVVLTGQSLGGGLAAAASMANEIPAVTFNAAGVHDKTLERHGLDADALKREAEQGLIRSYRVEGEILTHLQENSIPLKWAMPDAPGHAIVLPEPDPLSFFERLVPGKMLMHRIDLHFIEAVMEAQDLSQLQVRERNHGAARPSVGDVDSTPNRLLRDAVTGLATQRGSLDLHDNERFLNTAASMATRAERDGLDRIDHVVASRRGDSVFAVQGSLHDPAHRRSLVDLDEAAHVPARQSAAILREHDEQQRGQAQQQMNERQQGVMLA